MPSKGYSALPTDEPRESADMESRPHEPYRDDPDAEPSASDRLLPSGAPDENEDMPPCPHREPFRTKAARWVKSRPNYIASKCRAFRKRHSIRSILLVALIGFLLASTTGLAISTGILAARPSRCWSCYIVPQTRIPHASWGADGRYATYSSNNQLDFSALFPPLSRDAEPSCRSAWALLEKVDCHEKVLNRAWDHGMQHSLFEPRYDLYAEAISRTSCVQDLELTHQLLSSQCTNKDKFDTSEYVGPFTADPYLEEGPIAAVETILARAHHAGRMSPDLPGRRRYDWHHEMTCAAELYQDWFIVDGMYSANLHGLDTFLKATASRSEDPDRQYYRYTLPDDRCDGVYSPYRSWNFRAPTKGPDDGETECSWCLLNWFDRKLGSWEDGKVVDPKNGTTVDLEPFLKTIEHAGRRCQSSDWERIYRKNIWMYQEKGWLPEDWEGDSLKSRPISQAEVDEWKKPASSGWRDWDLEDEVYARIDDRVNPDDFDDQFNIY